MSKSQLMPRPHRAASVAVTAILGVVAMGCSGSDDAASPATAGPSIEAAVDGPIQVLAPAEFEAFVANNPDVPLINVHIPYEMHIDGTDTFIPFDTILESDALPADTSAPIALYCRSGNMSQQASEDLADAGYTNIVDLEGGMNAWADAGEVLVDDPAAVAG